MALREIIFRGKRLGDGKWIEGNYWEFCGGHNIMAPGTCIGSRVDPATVGQYTGLLDNQGKRIFENDTVRFKRKFVHGGAVVMIGRIVYDERNARFHISDSDNYICWDIYEVEDLEVVHNDHELLEVSEND